MKRVVSSSIITLLILLAVAAAFIYLRNFRSEGGDPVQAIPADAAFFIVYDSDSGNASNLTGLQFWKPLSQTPTFAALKKVIFRMDSTSEANAAFRQFVTGGPVFISAHVTSASDFDFLFLKSMQGNFNESSIDKLIPELAGQVSTMITRNYDGNVIREVKTGDKIFTYAIAKGIFMGSYTSFIVEDALRQLKVGKPVFKNYSNTSKNYEQTHFNLFLNFNNLPGFINIFTEAEKSQQLNNLRLFGEWGIAGTEFSNNLISFNGYIPLADSTFLVNCFEGQQPVDKKLLNILPAKTAHVFYVGLSDFDSYYRKLSGGYLNSENRIQKKKITDKIKSNYNIDIEQKFVEWIGNEYAFVITEPSGTSFDNNCYAIFRAKDIAKGISSLKAISKVIDNKNGSTTMEEVYNDYAIGLVRLNNLLPVLFGDIFSKVPGMYYTAVGDYIVFANKASSLRSFIDDYRSASFLIKTENFKSVQHQLPLSGNLFYMIRPASAFYIFKAIANDQWKEYADRYRDVISEISLFSFQLNAGDKNHRITAAVQFKSGGTTEGVGAVFGVETDSSVKMKPLLTTDPLTKSRQILFQDDAEVMYLVDNSGNVVWKQQLSGGGILGEIHEIDLFKNNSRQFLFNTREYIYLLDTEGKPVGNYPIRLPAPATNGVAVYDFEGRNEHRLYVACENSAVYAYLPSGKPLPGWVFKERTGRVNEMIRLVRIGGREYLMINDDAGNIYILNRFGEATLPVTSKVLPAEFTSYYQGPDSSLIFTDVEGNVIEIKASGSVETLPLNIADANHGFLYADADANGEIDFIFVNNNELVAYNRSLVMIYRKVFEYELSGPIQLIKLKSGEQVMCLRSQSADKTWLVKMNGSVLQGFPVKGSGIAAVDELNLDGNRNLFVGGNDNRFYVYSLE